MNGPKNLNLKVILAVPYKHWQLLDYIKSLKFNRALKPLLVFNTYNICTVENLHDSKKDSINQTSAITLSK